MSNQELLDATARAADNERRATVELLALLAEVDARRLYLGEGCSSLFTYCTQVLHLSEHAAYHRIEVARAAGRFPLILELVADGAVTLTTAAMLRPHLTADNHESLLAAARHKTKREVEHQLACLAPKPGAAAVIRRLPIPHTAIASLLPVTSDVTAATIPPPGTSVLERTPKDAMPPVQPRSKIEPLAKDRYLLRVTLSAEATAKLRRAQDLMRHVVPDGDPGEILESALTALVDKLEKAKIAKTLKPREAREVVARLRFIASHSRDSEAGGVEAR